ncbi:Hypothetical predicted protein [Mytilus galloprovincialis]|uniref:DZIP3-like HEPN domain-containing protein n=1 Tax=Mytilus galloprovincialis TaxID=29158 RepID=A0A8B6HH59_MYTGA|nr:Hypothetical predicted protein [Mytilus galloprovincialis]
MSTNTPEVQELLRLYKCVIDTGADVLVPFAEDKLLKTYNGNFERFLDDKKHELFHLWHSKKLLCCACPPAGCTLKRTGHMDNWIFEKLYDDVGIEHTGHIIRNSGKVVQMCLHKYVTRNIGIHELDTVALSFLLQNFATLLPNEDTALVTIKRNRNKICHVHSPNCYDMTFLNTAWAELEKSLVDLTSPSYKGVMKKQISYLRKVNLEKEEITELLKHVQDGIKEIETLNNTAIEKCEKNLKTTVVEESLVIQQCISDGSDSMKHAHDVVLQEIISSKSDAKESGDKILEQISILNTNQASNDLEMSKQLKQIVEMLHQINNTTFLVKYEQSKGSSEGEECLVLWQLVTPANWNAVAVEEILTRFEERFNDLPMKIKFVRNGSLVIMTTVSAEVFKESSAFQSAVKAFLTRMVEICHIDTHVSCNVDVTLHILESDKMNLTCSLSNKPTESRFVQTEVNSLTSRPTEHKFVQTEVVESSTTPNPTVVDDGSPIRLEFNPSEIENIGFVLPQLGNLTTLGTHRTSLDWQSQLHLVENSKGNIICLESFKTTDIECSVESGCFLAGGKLIFTNFDRNYCLHKFDRKGLGCTKIELDGAPMDVATYNATFVLVAIRDRGIQIINVETNMCEQYIYHRNVYAIQCENKNIWISAGKANIYRIDIDGHILQTFNVRIVVQQMALDTTGEHVFFSPLTSDKIYTLSTDGKQALFYTCIQNITFNGLAVDSKGNMIIADTYSNCIRRISQDGENIETILSIDDGISKPDHLQFNSKTNELLVLSVENGSIQIFKLI